MPARHTRLSAASAQGALAESLAALRESLELPGDFPAEVTAEVSAVLADGKAVDGSDEARTDLREVEFLTIDPEGSRDLDQAMHIARDGEGFVVRYAIADLAAFVRPGGALDAEVRRRGQTLYAADGSVPLHPLELSHGAASLLPEEDRRAYVWTFRRDAQGAPAGTDAVTLERAWVRSRRQWTYVEAQAEVDAGSAPETLLLLAELGPLLIAEEAARGGASLNTPEEEVTETPDGYRLQRRVSVPLEDFNAQISLMTGMAAAAIMIDRGAGILRTLPPAEPDAIAEFRQRVATLGVTWAEGVSYGDFLRAQKPDAPATPAIMQAATALFRGASYAAFLSPAEIPAQPEQAAIGAPYAHATAPLRRLVDRYVLRACMGDVDAEAIAEVPEIMQRTGQLASQLESGVIDRVEAAVLSGRLGDEFDALVVSQTKGGARIQLADPFVIGTLPGDHAPGSSVRVRVADADIAAGRVVFEAV